MNNSFFKIFGIAFVISLILLAALEWSINKRLVTEHVIGWAFVAAFIGALMGIIIEKKNNSH